MIYSNWGGVTGSPLVSRLGFGTTRYKAEDLQDEAGIDRCSRLALYAIEKGINYFDVAPTYSYGYAEKILGNAFRRTDRKIYVAAKTGLTIDRTADDLQRRLDNSLTTLSREKIDFYYMWSVMNMEQYGEIISPGGLYEGALRAKEQGLIDRICISLHCDPESALKIVKSGLFEGVTISMNALNYQKWSAVIAECARRNIGIATMNSLAGGIIPRYGNLFEKLDKTSCSVPVKALRFLASFDVVNVLLSGMNEIEQIDENCSAFDTPVPGNGRDFVLETRETLCTGCNYCAPCTVGIPISACLQAYNHKILVESSNAVSDEQKLVSDTFVVMRANGVDFTGLRKCIHCRRCEKKCTQKLNISQRLDTLSAAAEKYNYTGRAMLKRLGEVENECRQSGKIAIWPACDYASRMFDMWKNADFEKKCEYFDSSSSRWGKEFRGKIIHSPDEIDALGIDTVLITHYTLRNEIYNDLKTKYPQLKKIIKVNTDDDIDWFNRALGR